MRRRWITVLSLLLFAACSERRGELREWQPSDHQAPRGGVAEGDGRAAPAEEDPDPEATEIRVATALFGSLCASCHGPTGRGDGPGRPPIAQIPDLASAEWQRSRSDAEIAQVIRDGRGGFMPGFGDRLSQAGVEALTRHVRRLGGVAAGTGAGATGAGAAGRDPAETGPAQTGTGANEAAERPSEAAASEAAASEAPPSEGAAPAAGAP